MLQNCFCAFVVQKWVLCCFFNLHIYQAHESSVFQLSHVCNSPTTNKIFCLWSEGYSLFFNWLHENSIPKIGCDYFWPGLIDLGNNTLPKLASWKLLNHWSSEFNEENILAASIFMRVCMHAGNHWHAFVYIFWHSYIATVEYFLE
jgi:hypothetical protein